MPQSKNKRAYVLQTDKDEIEKFNSFYPGLLKIFLNNAIYLANRDKFIFEKIFFKDLKDGE